MFNFFNNKKGATNIVIASIGAVGAIVASVFASWGTSSVRINEVDKKVAVVEERENLHYAEIGKRLTSIDDKLGKLFDQQLASKKLNDKQ